MVEGLASRQIDYVAENGADKEQRAAYVYRLVCFINELLSSTLLPAIALLLNRIWQIVVWMMTFGMLHFNISGYHTDTPVRCIIESASTETLCTSAYPLRVKGPYSNVQLVPCASLLHFYYHRSYCLLGLLIHFLITGHPLMGSRPALFWS